MLVFLFCHRLKDLKDLIIIICEICGKKKLNKNLCFYTFKVTLRKKLFIPVFLFCHRLKDLKDLILIICEICGKKT